MVENRRYSQLELTYVLSRILANWKPEVIAKAFKRDHAPYWDDKVFTKKQVSYIKNTYRGPPGSVQPYAGPIPEFTPSPTRSRGREASSLPKMDRYGNKSKVRCEASKADKSLNDVSSMMMTTAVGNQAQQFLGGQQETVPMMTEEEMSQFFDFDRYYNEPAAPTTPYGGAGDNSNGGDSSSAGPASSQTAATSFVAETGASDKTGGVQNYFPDDDQLLDFNEFMASSSQFQDHSIQNPSLPPQGAPQDPAPSKHDAPLPSVENVQPDQPEGDAVRNRSARSSVVPFNFNGSPLDTPVFMQENFEQLPTGFTHHNFVAQDDFGWNYSGAHDNCAIACAHRHEGDGGVFFADVEALMAWVRATQQDGVVVPQNTNDLVSNGVALQPQDGVVVPQNTNDLVSNGVALQPQDDLLNAPCALELGAPAVDNNQQLLGAPAFAFDPYQSNDCAASFNGGLQQSLGFAGAYGQQDLGQLTMNPYGMAHTDLALLYPGMFQPGGLSQAQPDWWAMDVWNMAVANGNLDAWLIAEQAAYESQQHTMQMNLQQLQQGTTNANNHNHQAVAPAQQTTAPRSSAQPRPPTTRSGTARLTATAASRHGPPRASKAGAGTTKSSSSASASASGGGSSGGRRRRAVDTGDDDFDFLNPTV